jgi:hypothetical protein
VALHLARDLPETGSKPCACGVSGKTESPGFTTGSRQIVRMRPRHKPRSYRDCVNLTFLFLLWGQRSSLS